MSNTDEINDQSHSPLCLDSSSAGASLLVLWLPLQSMDVNNDTKIVILFLNPEVALVICLASLCPFNGDTISQPDRRDQCG